MEPIIKVRRNGKVMEIPRHDVVVGDVVLNYNIFFSVILYVG